MKKFLATEAYAVMIAKITIIFQSTLTLLITTLLLLVLGGRYEFTYLLTTILWLDIIFVVIHLLYRGLYTGKKVILVRNDKIILLIHILSALLALGLTFGLLQYGLQEISQEFVCITLFTWVTSLVFGIMFYLAKYNKK